MSAGYDMTNSQLDELLGILGVSGIMGAYIVFMLIIFAFSLFVSLISYVLYRIPLYKMAKKAGMPNAGIVWIPYCIEYVELALPQGEFEIFKGFLHCKKRSTPFWIYLAITIGKGLIISTLSILSSVTFGITGFIGGIIAPFFVIAVKFYKWRFDYDLYNCFDPVNPNTNTVISIVGLFFPIVRLVYYYILMGHDPEYGAGRYSEVHSA